MEEKFRGTSLLHDLFPDQAYLIFNQTWYQRGIAMRSKINRVDAPHRPVSKSSRKKGSYRWLARSTKTIGHRQLVKRREGLKGDTLFARLTHHSVLKISNRALEMGSHILAKFNDGAYFGGHGNWSHQKGGGTDDGEQQEHSGRT